MLSSPPDPPRSELMSEKFARPKGTFDILPSSWCGELWKSSSLWRQVETKLHQIAAQFGFEEMRSPYFESTALFQKGVGASSDIVMKEMYTFSDKGERSLTLRPEGTLGAVRAILENGGSLGDQRYRHQHRLYYLGPMFRYERPQAGRYRQFHQFGVEAIGQSSWQSDVEILDLALSSCRALGIDDVVLEINTLGDWQDRERFKSKLRDYLEPKKDHLSQVSQRRLSENPLRILDSKEPQDRALLLGAPTLSDSLSAASQERFAQVVALLQKLTIPHIISPKLVRGLDYYGHTVFEITCSSLGAQNSICGGGRYDDLFQMLGQSPRPAMGFGMGLERVMQAMSDKALLNKTHCDLYLIGLNNASLQAQLALAKQVRQAGWAVIVQTEIVKLPKALQMANEQKARFVAIVGDAELHQKGVQLKDMVDRKESFCPIDQVIAALSNPR